MYQFGYLCTIAAVDHNPSFQVKPAVSLQRGGRDRNMMYMNRFKSTCYDMFLYTYLHCLFGKSLPGTTCSIMIFYEVCGYRNT